MHTQIIIGLLSSGDGGFCAALQLGVVVPEPSDCQLVVYVEVGHLGHRGEEEEEDRRQADRVRSLPLAASCVCFSRALAAVSRVDL